MGPRGHSLALVQAPVNAMNHLMVELYSLDDVGQGYDLALMNRKQIAATLGRHNNDLMTWFYIRTPSVLHTHTLRFFSRVRLGRPRR